jgi:hypothetical protein
MDLFVDDLLEIVDFLQMKSTDFPIWNLSCPIWHLLLRVHSDESALLLPGQGLPVIFLRVGSQTTQWQTNLESSPVLRVTIDSSSGWQSEVTFFW